MVCVEDMLCFFKNLNSALRVETICGLFEMCTPFELRFFSTVLEDYGKRDCVHVLKEAEQKLNTESEILKLTNLSDPVVRSNLLISLILIESSNRLCATRIFNLLTDELQSDKLTLTLHSDEKCANDIGLMLTLATHHPAFSFQQQRLLSDKLLKIREILASSVPSQEYDIYNNALWSVPPQHSTGLDIIPGVLSINPGLAVTTAYVTDWPQDLTGSPSPPSVEHLRAQLSSLDLTGIEKNQNYRIKGTWTNGKSFEVVKSYSEIYTLHQKLLQYSAQTTIGDPDSVIPLISSLSGGVDDNDAIYNQLAEFLRHLSTNISFLNHELVLAFLNLKNIPTAPLSVVNPISPLYSDDNIQRLRSPPSHNTYGQQTAAFQTVTPLSELANVETMPQINSTLADSRPSSRPTALPCSSPAASPLSSPVSSPYVSPPASGTSSRSASPWQQHHQSQMQQTYNNNAASGGSYNQPAASYYHRSNSSSVTRALRSSSKTGGGNPNNCGSSSSSSSSGYGNNTPSGGQVSSRTNSNSDSSKVGMRQKCGENLLEQLLTKERLRKYIDKLRPFRIVELQDMSIEELEIMGLQKGAAGKLKKLLHSIDRNNPPNGANVYHNHNHQNRKQQTQPPVTSSHGNNNPVGCGGGGGNALPPSQLPSTYNFSPSSRQRSESSPSCSEYSSPPPSPPLLEGIQGQNTQLNSQTSSSSEENLTSDQCSPMAKNGRVLKASATAPVSFVNSATYTAVTTATIPNSTTHNYGVSNVVNNYANAVAVSFQIPSRQTNGLPENPSPIVTTAPMMLHPFKPNSLQLNQNSSSLSNRYNLAPIIFNPALMGATCNTSVPPPGLPRPSHLNAGVTLPQNGQGQGMMPFAGPSNAPPQARNPTLMRNGSNGGGSVTTVTSMHGNNHGSHRYTPPKSHAIVSSSVVVDKNLMPSQNQAPPQQTNSPLPTVPDMMPYMIFTQPPPPVPSSVAGNIMPINCPSNCSCSTPVSSTMGPSLSPSGVVPTAPPNQPVGTLTNGGGGGGPPVAVTVPYHHSYMHVYHPHALQFMTTHAGCAGGVNNFISATLPTHFSYPLPNGMNVTSGASQNAATHHELLYNSPLFPLIAPPGTTPNGACSNTLQNTPNVQQGTLPPNATTIVPPFPGVPFPQTMKVATCYNCGLTGHRGPDCKENTADDSAKSNS